MQVNLHEAKARLSELIDAVESGEEVVVARRRKPVARIIPVTHSGRSRIGGLSGRPYRMGKPFDDPQQSALIADDFGVAEG